MSNMELWNKVEKTDPSHTKQVNFGRKYTAIDPYHQIKNATSQFGPAGQKWGWQIMDVQHLITSEVAVLVRVWVNAPDRFIEQWGQTGLYIDNKMEKKDTDCMKKATTDAITKCLSYMGFNADIFLGKFDDNKYVNDLKREKQQEQQQGQKQKQQTQQGQKKQDPAKVVGRIIANLNEVCTRADMKTFEDNRDIKSAYDNLPPEFKAQVDDVYNRKMATLNGEENPFEDAA